MALAGISTVQSDPARSRRPSGRTSNGWPASDRAVAPHHAAPPALAAVTIHAAIGCRATRTRWIAAASTRLVPASTHSSGTAIPRRCAVNTIGQRSDHHHRADAVERPRDLMVVHREPRHAEDLLPVVPVDLRAGVPAEEHDRQRSRVVGVVRDVDEALARPPRHHRGAEAVRARRRECDPACDRDDQLHQRAAEDGEKLAERAERDVTGFVKYEIDQVHERRADDVLAHRPDEKQNGPAGQDQQQDDAAGAPHVAYLFLATIWISNSFGHSLPVTKSRSCAASYAMPLRTSVFARSLAVSRPRRST